VACTTDGAEGAVVGRGESAETPPPPLVTRLRRALLQLTLGGAHVTCAAEVATEACAALLQGYAVLVPSLDDRYTLLQQCLQRVTADVHPSQSASQSASQSSTAAVSTTAGSATLAVRLAEHAMDDLTTLPRLHHATRAAHSTDAELSVVRTLWALLSEHTRAALRGADGGLAAGVGSGTMDEACMWPAAVVRSASRLLVGLLRSLVAHTSVPPQPPNAVPAEAARAAAACTTDFMCDAMITCEGLLRDALAAVGNATSGQRHVVSTQVYDGPRQTRTFHT